MPACALLAEGPDGSAVLRIALAGDGRLRAATRNALYREDGERWLHGGADGGVPQGGARELRLECRFELPSRNEDAVRSATPVSASFEVPPTFGQSRTVLLLCLLVAVALVFALVKWRVRQARRREFDRMTARMGERERIARELHDTLLQKTQAVVMMIGAATTRLERGEPAIELLDRAASTGKSAVVEARERIQELRRAFDGQVDLRSELQVIGGRLASEPGAARFELVGAAPRIGCRSAGEVLHIGREALLNAYRHAHASLVRLELSQEGDDLVLRVLDDGVGIDEPARTFGAAPGRWGLLGMRERAWQLGGSLSVESRPGGGTAVTLRLPIAAADDAAPSASDEREPPSR